MTTLNATDWPKRERLHERIVAEVAESGWCVIEHYIHDNWIRALRTACIDLARAGRLLTAGVGRGNQHHLDTRLRGDRTHWLDQQDDNPQAHALLAEFDLLRLAFNADAFLGLTDLEAHYAHYAPGTHYGVHRDRFRDDDRRAISLVLYLNDAWREHDGGALRLYFDDRRTAYQDVLPEGGRLLVFRSERFEHEVRTTARDRYSVAAWLRRR
jgi:SM-20-related protein